MQLENNKCLSLFCQIQTCLELFTEQAKKFIHQFMLGQTVQMNVRLPCTPHLVFLVFLRRRITRQHGVLILINKYQRITVLFSFIYKKIYPKIKLLNLFINLKRD